MIQSLLFWLLLFLSASATSQSTGFRKYPENPRFSTAQEPSRSAAHRLSKPLIGEDGRIYACSEKILFAFESNGTIAWTINLGYTCHAGMAPVHGGQGKIYLVAENRVLKIDFLNIGTSEPPARVFFGPVPDQEGLLEIIGLSVRTLSSSVFINIKNRGLFAYTTRGQLLWSAGPVLYRFGFRQGCRRNSTDCYFTSAPMVDQCEASIYISNTEGELYALSVRSPDFRWIQDFSSLDKVFTVTPGNNGRLYVTVPARALMLALDVASGWISIGSLDGFLYSFSPTGMLKKFSKADTQDLVVQVGPLLDCSGYAVYLSQTVMEGKISHTIGEYTYVSAMRPKAIIFTLLVPSTGSISWSESLPEIGNPLQCRTKRNHSCIILHYFTFCTASNSYSLPGQKLASSCSQARSKHLSIYTGNEKAIMLFLLFESAVLVILLGLVRFCCIFWRKKKLQVQDLGSFLEKRRSLLLKKKVFDRTITKLEQKAAPEAVANEFLEKLRTLVREREGIERKLSTTYSLGRDRPGSRSTSLLPVYDRKTRSFSFQGAKKESVTVFHTLSDTSSAESSGEKETSWGFREEESAAKAKAKAKAPIEAESSGDDGSFEEDYWRGPSETTSSSRGVPIHHQITDQELREVKLQKEEIESKQIGNRLTRRKALYSSKLETG
ncbi:Protein GAMETE EXPRESSED 3 [Morella rubra]|uniref:Protein GAMETE EXPRESSED 3 n=1 Tax=Morella rubra TaxID=262757 RepID=A0A6A1VGS8_9ROSI|nr:Protein GAMETE EXPRESSED 3 [Morella rubra]